MDKIVKLPKLNETLCVDDGSGRMVCGAAALNKTGLTKEQDSIASVNTSLITNFIIGLACMFGFLFFRTFMKQYQLRAILPQITVKPPRLPKDTWLNRVFGWLVPVFVKSDAYILRAAGLDALVLQKIHAIGVQICLPLAIIGCCLVLPLQISEKFIQGDASYGRLTAANIRPRSPIMWAHCIMLFVMLGWIFMLLEYHTREYATVRQHYLKGSDDPNYWRDLHMAEADGTLVHKQSKLLAVVGELKHEQELEQLLEEMSETAGKRTWWQKAMISLTSWTGQESAETATHFSSALMYHGKKKKMMKQQQQQGELDKEATPSGRLHIDLAHDIVQGDFVRDAKLRASGSTPASPAAAAGSRRSSGTGSPAAAAGDGSTAGAAAAAAAAGGHGSSSLHSLTSMAPSRQGKGAGPSSPFEREAQLASVDDADTPWEAPMSQCDLEAENISNLVSHKWWTQVEHVATTDGRLRRLTEEEAQAEEVKQVMLAKPSVRYRKTINATDNRGRRLAVHAQQYAVLVTNVNQPCYPEYHMQRSLAPGAHMCGNLNKGAIPTGVKYALEGPLQGHAEALPPHLSHMSSSKSFDPTRSGRLPAIEDDAAAAAAGGSSKRQQKGAANGKRSDKDVGDVELGVHYGPHDASHEPHPHFHTQPYHRDICTTTATDSDTPAGPTNSSGTRQRSGKELWALVRQFAADRKTPGRSLYLLGRDKDYSVVAFVFSQLFPDDYDRVVPVFNFRRVDLLMRKWDVRQGQLESAECKLKRTGQRPVRKTKCCGGEKVDAIDWLKDDIKRLEESILMERDAALVYGQTPSWFVLFRSQKAAAVAASCNILPMNQDLFQVHPAPGPEEVNWESLWFNHAQRRLRQFVTTPFAVLVVGAPVSLLTSAISSLSGSFCSAIKWKLYCEADSAFGKILKGLVTGFLPSLLIILWQGLALPRLVYLVAQSEGRHLSLFAVDRRMGELYFFWNIFNMFLQGVLGSAAVNAATGSLSALKKSAEIVNAPQEVFRIVGEALPASSKFFFTYIIMRTFMSVPLRFLITQPGVWQSWFRLCDLHNSINRPQKNDPSGQKGAGTADGSDLPPRTRFMRLAIRSPRYGVEYGSTLLILLISMAFALISPLIVVFGTAFCGGMWVYWRYQLMYNYQRKYESGGLMWHFFVNRVLVCCAIMAAFTGCVLIIKQGFVQAALVWVVGIISTISFANHLNHKYMNAIVEMPLLLANAAPRARVPSSIYVPPPLQANGLGWYPEFNKCWEWFGMPGYSF